MIAVYKIDESEEWNELVKSFKDYDVYYLSDYVKAFEIHGDGKPVLLYYEGFGLRAINVVMKRDISMDKRFTEKIPPSTYFDFSTPYGYGGFLLEGEMTKNNLDQLKEAYYSFCKKEGIISEFVRFHPVLKNSKTTEEIYEVSTHGKTITMELKDKTQIWNDLSSKNRNCIRKSVKSGVEVFWGRDPELIEKFKVLYNAIMDKDQAKEYYYFDNDFYHSILHDLKNNSLIFYAVLNGKTIAMSIVLFSNNQMHYHLSASDINNQHLAPTNLLLYEAACWGSENGYTIFHLGGGLGSKEDNLYKFKKAFNRNSENRFSTGRKIFDEEKFQHLINLRRKEEMGKLNDNYFPRYRLGN